MDEAALAKAIHGPACEGASVLGRIDGSPCQAVNSPYGPRLTKHSSVTSCMQNISSHSAPRIRSQRKRADCAHAQLDTSACHRNVSHESGLPATGKGYPVHLLTQDADVQKAQCDIVGHYRAVKSL